MVNRQTNLKVPVRTKVMRMCEGLEENDKFR